MSIVRTLAIARRIVIQIVRDHRTLALILVVPVMVMTLVGLSFSEKKAVLDFAAPALVGALVMFFVFILTGVSFLRERTQGTLERLLATPVGRGDVLLGYLVGFLVF
ncbi:MAG: ABC transporter permease, partial [Dehalococcoidia bacterium]|nr:ABC transporter permease [Dehalococcoidia bacterium]